MGSRFSSGSFYGEGKNAFFWSSTEGNNYNAWNRYLTANNRNLPYVAPSGDVVTPPHQTRSPNVTDSRELSFGRGASVRSHQTKASHLSSHNSGAYMRVVLLVCVGVVQLSSAAFASFASPATPALRRCSTRPTAEVAVPPAPPPAAHPVTVGLQSMHLAAAGGKLAMLQVSGAPFRPRIKIQTYTPTSYGNGAQAALRR